MEGVATREGGVKNCKDMCDWTVLDKFCLLRFGFVFWEAVGCHVRILFAAQGIYKLDCNAGSRLPTVTFVINGTQFPLTGSEYIYKVPVSFFLF